jgi:hypothetical protein
MPDVYESAESDALNDTSNGAGQPVYVYRSHAYIGLLMYCLISVALRGPFMR